jgi:trans-aconitate 2-methyltransferase
MNSRRPPESTAGGERGGRGSERITERSAASHPTRYDLRVPTWNADQYLQFGDERTQPCRDLVARIAVASPQRIIDLGCGPGNSTDVLARRWPAAELTGLDGSPEMVDAARRMHPERRWVVGDIATWAAGDDGPFDVVFSNAAMQWVDDHATTYPRILAHAAPGGALAVQVPGNLAAPAHRLMRELAQSDRWRTRFPAAGVLEWHVHDPKFYYDVLAPHAARIEIWETEYLHVMAGPEGIVDWYKGTGLRPFLDALASDSERASFTEHYLELVRVAFPRRPDGRVLFPFRRLFVLAYRPSA